MGLEPLITSESDSKKLTLDEKHFAEFYSSYPKKVSKQDAAKAYQQVIKRGITHSAIMAGLERAKQSDNRFRDQKYTPYPASWLRAGGYEDQAGTAAPRNLREEWGLP